MRFHILGDQDPDLNKTNEMFFTAGEHENKASLYDILVTKEDDEDD